MAYTTIDDPTKYFNTLLYTGDGSSSRSITGVGFAPDWIWVKERSSTSQHQLVDRVRGSDRRLQSDSSDSEDIDTSPFVDFKSLDSDGWSMGNGGAINENSQTYVAWNWLAGGTASSNSDGSITSSVSANTTAGFSIATYTGTASGATVGHGLGTTPAWVLVKERGASGESWNNFHQSLGAGKTIMLNLTNAEQSSSTMWNNTAPTSSVFSVGVDAGSNGSSKTYVAYCFAEKKGYSKFGSYTGNGNADGTFAYTGFKPSFVIYKRTDTGADWHMYDNKRDPFNEMDLCLFPSGNYADSAGDALDFLSNGFKQRNTGAEANASGGTYIYMAFAESPFVTAGTKAAGTAR